MINNNENEDASVLSKKFSTNSFATSSFRSARQAAFSSSNHSSSSTDSLDLLTNRLSNKSKLSVESDYEFGSGQQSSFNSDFFKGYQEGFTRMQKSSNLSMSSSSRHSAMSSDSAEAIVDRLPNNPSSKLSVGDHPFNSSLHKSFNNDFFRSHREEFSNMQKSNNISGFNFEQNLSSNFSNASVTRTVSNKTIKKKITRTVVNGQVVEQEEEYDEIENEPITEQYVVEDRSNSCKTKLDVFGGQNFDIGKSKSCPAVTNSDNLRQKKENVKAIEAPAKKPISISSVLNFRKKKKKINKNVGKILPIINELKTTEENYVKDLYTIVEDYMTELQRSDAPEELKDKNREKLFGNVEILYMFHDVEFLPALRETDNHPEDIAKCFLIHGKHFKLYRHFNKNQPRAEIYLEKYELFFKEKQEALHIPMDLRSYLIRPTQRLCRYILLMKELLNECEKHGLDRKDVREAVEMLEKENRLGNDLMALDAIKDFHMDVNDQGDLTYRHEFEVQRGTEASYKAMVFLFEKIILFTKIVLENKVDVLYYQDFIHLKDIGLTECPNDPKMFKVWFHKFTLKPYTLRTHNKKAKETWVNEIKAQLQFQLEQTKKENEVKKKGVTLIDLKKIEQEKVKK